MRITTKNGDKGKTKLCGGKTMPKCDARIRFQGALDELNCFLGLAKVKREDNEIKEILGSIQEDIRRIMLEVAGSKRFSSIPQNGIGKDDVQRLEEIGGGIESKLSPPFCFVVPGANESSALLHIARAVARRAECLASELNEKKGMNPCALSYLNRLSDVLFMMAVAEERRVGR